MGGTRGGASRVSRTATVVAVAIVVALPMGLAGAAEQAPDTGKPPAGSGINTAAAYANPQCVRDEGPYGQLEFLLTEPGPVCLPQWEAGKDNGGATYDGVTADSISVIALVPNEQQFAALPRGGAPTNYTTNQTGTIPDALEDALTAYEGVFGGTYTYGRDIDLQFVVSSGSDEAAQRADAVSVIAEKPFVVIDAVGTSVNTFNIEDRGGEDSQLLAQRHRGRDPRTGSVPLG